MRRLHWRWPVGPGLRKGDLRSLHRAMLGVMDDAADGALRSGDEWNEKYG